MNAKTRRTWLWAWLLMLIAVLLGSLIWLVGRYEQSRFEDQLEIAVADLASDIRSNLNRHTQRFQVLLGHQAPDWGLLAKQILDTEPTILRIERRSSTLQIEEASNTAFLNRKSQQGIFEYLGRKNFNADVTHACMLAARLTQVTYSINYFVPVGDGTGFEVTDMCIAQYENNKITGYLVVTYSLDRVLKEWGASNLKRQEAISFKEADGSRLAMAGNNNRPGTPFVVETVLSLPGNQLVLRLESWRSAPYWLANTPTALALLLVVALIGVLWLLYRDTRRRHRTEARLAREIIQQRKSEEVSRQSLERLQKSARLATLGEMASMLSHELNQPLAVIASYASGSLNLLTEDEKNGRSAETTKQIQIALERIAKQSERAGLVIKSVHDFVRRRETERALISPQSLLNEVLPLLGLQAKQMNVQLTLVVAKNLPAVWCDKTLVEQVIINLARNGMQAMGMQTMGTQTIGIASQKSEPTALNQRVLTLTAQAGDADKSGEVPQVEFQVQDHGPGLSPLVREKLFTPFFTTKMEGMGLGLSLCRTVIEQHGGTLTYTTSTEPPLSGTIFSFKLMTEHATPA